MFKRCNAAIALSGRNPSRRRVFLRISALLVAVLAQLNFAPRALNCAKIGAGAHADNFETASIWYRIDRRVTDPLMHKASRFHVGQLVHHRLFDYRGVVFDVDSAFAGSDEWYEQVALSRPPKDKPWYHVMPDGAAHTTYVAERNLEPDPAGDKIVHPLLETIFEDFVEGGYSLRNKPN
jgi:heat shock protein HspQ